MEEVKILRVELKGKKYLVYTSCDDDAVSLTEDIIVYNKVLKNAIFTKEIWEKIKSENNESTLYNKVLHYIDYKPRTEKEIREYLKKLDTSLYVINNIISKLNNIKYLDDDRYAKDYILEGIRNFKGPSLIYQKLDELGIKKETLNKYLGLYDKDIEYENALNIATKYLKQVSSHPSKKQRELIYSKLVRSGYSYDICSKVINALEYSEDDLDKLNELYIKITCKTNDKNKIITHLIAKGYKYEDIKKIMNNNK